MASFGVSTRTWSPHGGLTIGFAAVSDCCDRDRVLIFEIEEHAVVAAAEAESSEWSLQLLHVAGAASEVTIHTVEDLHGGFAVDGDRGDPLRRWRLAHLLRPNSRRMSSWEMPSP